MSNLISYFLNVTKFVVKLSNANQTNQTNCCHQYYSLNSFNSWSKVFAVFNVYLSPPSSFHNDYFKRLEDELNIIPKTGVLHILQIQFYLLLHDHIDVVVLRILRHAHQLILVAELD